MKRLEIKAIPLTKPTKKPKMTQTFKSKSSQPSTTFNTTKTKTNVDYRSSQPSSSSSKN